jgi:hypothetical protein
MADTLADKESPLFHEVEDAYAILKSRGVYRQSKVFERRGYLYAAYGSGFVRLHRHLNGTSNPNIAWDELRLPYDRCWDSMGRIVSPNFTGAKRGN